MKYSTFTRKTFTGLFAAALLLPGTIVRGGEVNTGYFGNVAIKGYDPVAYFTLREPTRGSESYALEWLAATWYFSSDEHRKLFSDNPVKYAPQYGGYCSDGVAYGDLTTNIDPSAWRIIDGKLYLNSDLGAAAELEEAPGQGAEISRELAEDPGRASPGGRVASGSRPGSSHR